MGEGDEKAGGGSPPDDGPYGLARDGFFFNDAGGSREGTVAAV